MSVEQGQPAITGRYDAEQYAPYGAKLEITQAMANHESARTTALYDRRNDQVSLDEMERVQI